MRADKDSGTEIAKRTDTHLEYLSIYLKDLPEIVAERVAGELLEGEYISLSIEWDDLMARLKVLDEYHRAGQLTKEQEEAYWRLKDELKEALPLIEELNFYRPPVEL